jgi:hypothetical protein
LAVPPVSNFVRDATVMWNEEAFSLKFAMFEMSDDESGLGTGGAARWWGRTPQAPVDRNRATPAYGERVTKSRRRAPKSPAIATPTDAPSDAPAPPTAAVVRDALGVGVAVGLSGFAFGVAASGAGLDVGQACG